MHGCSLKNSLAFASFTFCLSGCSLPNHRWLKAAMSAAYVPLNASLRVMTLRSSLSSCKRSWHRGTPPSCSSSSKKTSRDMKKNVHSSSRRFGGLCVSGVRACRPSCASIFRRFRSCWYSATSFSCLTMVSRVLLNIELLPSQIALLTFSDILHCLCTTTPSPTAHHSFLSVMSAKSTTWSRINLEPPGSASSSEISTSFWALLIGTMSREQKQSRAIQDREAWIGFRPSPRPSFAKRSISKATR
mmetsp:Transcript_38034/g.105836  ORF Transcript_38034/g.105836 Transcript_38034/m.105836 type:complete len:245 (+) Transcript_38034:1388-2122(+)